MKKYSNTVPLIAGILTACLAVGLVVAGLLWVLSESPAAGPAPARSQQAVSFRQIERGMMLYASDSDNPQGGKWYVVDENGQRVEEQEVNPMIRRVLDQAASEEMFVCPADEPTAQPGVAELPVERVTTLPVGATDQAQKEWDEFFRDPDGATTQPGR